VTSGPWSYEGWGTGCREAARARAGSMMIVPALSPEYWAVRKEHTGSVADYLDRGPEALPRTPLF
jgi:hypothetical protein